MVSVILATTLIVAGCHVRRRHQNLALVVAAAAASTSSGSIVDAGADPPKPTVTPPPNPAQGHICEALSNGILFPESNPGEDFYGIVLSAVHVDLPGGCPTVSVRVAVSNASGVVATYITAGTIAPTAPHSLRLVVTRVVGLEPDQRATPLGAWFATLHFDRGARSRIVPGDVLRLYTNKRVLVGTR